MVRERGHTREFKATELRKTTLEQRDFPIRPIPEGQLLLRV
jgi:hypothetical protein